MKLYLFLLFFFPIVLYSQVYNQLNLRLIVGTESTIGVGFQQSTSLINYEINLKSNLLDVFVENRIGFKFPVKEYKLIVYPFYLDLNLITKKYRTPTEILVSKQLKDFNIFAGVKTTFHKSKELKKSPILFNVGIIYTL